MTSPDYYLQRTTDPEPDCRLTIFVRYQTIKWVPENSILLLVDGFAMSPKHQVYYYATDNFQNSLIQIGAYTLLDHLQQMINDLIDRLEAHAKIMKTLYAKRQHINDSIEEELRNL